MVSLNNVSGTKNRNSLYVLRSSCRSCIVRHGERFQGQYVPSGLPMVPHGKRLVFVFLHDFPFTRAFVVDAAQVEDAVDNGAV